MSSLPGSQLENQKDLYRCFTRPGRPPMPAQINIPSKIINRRQRKNDENKQFQSTILAVQKIIIRKFQFQDKANYTKKDMRNKQLINSYRIVHQKKKQKQINKQNNGNKKTLLNTNFQH